MTATVVNRYVRIATANANYVIAGTGDLNGDTERNIDIIWRRNSTGEVGVWQMFGITAGDYHAIQVMPAGWQIAL